MIPLLFFITSSFLFTIHGLREIPYLSHDVKTPQDEEQYRYKVVIPPVQTKEVNRYICYSKSLDELGESYVTSLLTEPDMQVSPHHVDSGLCLDPLHEDATWECHKGLACKGNAVEFSVTDNFNSDTKPLYQLPKDVSSVINNGRKPHYLIVQVHLYEPLTKPASPANITITFGKKPTKYNYQKFMLANNGVIPANETSGFFSHVGCEWTRPKAFAFHYYVHTHTHGLFAEGFLVRNNTWIYLGGQRTQGRHKVQFDVLNGPVEILPGDILASRCLFMNWDKTPVHLGPEDTCIFQLSLGYEPQYQEYFARPTACMSSSPEFNFCSHEKTAALCDQ